MILIEHTLLSTFRPGSPPLLVLLGVLPALLGLAATRWFRVSRSPEAPSASLFCCLLFVMLLCDQMGLPLAQYVHFTLPISIMVFASAAVACALLPIPRARIFTQAVGAVFFQGMVIGLVRWHLESHADLLESFGAFTLAALLLGFSLFDSDLGSSSEKALLRASVDGAVATIPALLLMILATRLIDFETLHPTSATTVAATFAAYLFVRIFFPAPATWRRAAAPLVPAALLAFMAVSRSGAAWFGSGVLITLAIGGMARFHSTNRIETRLRLLAAIAAAALFVVATVRSNALAAPALPDAPETREILIPAGPFWLGCSQSDFKCEEGLSPGHSATISDPYEIDENEVTVAQYRACVATGHCATARLREPIWFKGEHRPDFSWACNWQVPGRGKHPINCVSWYQASDYCHWRGGELPTGEQYEKAARGTLDQRDYPWGFDGFDGVPRANIADVSASARFQKRFIAQAYDDGFEATAPVGSYPAGRSPYGVNDLVGNVEEWSLDWDDEEKGWKSIRGGSWHRPPVAAHIARRYRSPASGQPDYGGFRCVYESR